MLWQARRDSNPQHPDLESGALPLELLAYNQTDIKYALPSYPLTPACLLAFFMGRMFFAKTTVLIKLKFTGRRPLILGGRIVSLFAFGTY